MVEVVWYDDEQSIILQEFPETWTWEEFFDTVKQTVEMENSVSHPVYVMGTSPKNGRMPAGNALAQFNAAIKMHPPHMRYYIMVINNSLMAILGRIFLQTSALRHKTRLASSIEEALRIIAEDKQKVKQEEF